jgi:hypothetical protein
MFAWTAATNWAGLGACCTANSNAGGFRRAPRYRAAVTTVVNGPTTARTRPTALEASVGPSLLLSRRPLAVGDTVFVASCCDPREYDTEFDAAFAHRLAGRYRRRGLDAAAHRIVDVLTDRGVEGTTVLEIGGGIGDIQIELLKRGAARTVTVELSARSVKPAAPSSWAASASYPGCLNNIGCDRDVQDPSVDADVVVMHRVVCCHPDDASVLAAAAEHARRSAGS